MKTITKILKYIVSVLFMAVFFMPLYVPLFYEPTRSNYYWYEIVIYIVTLGLLSLIFYKLDKTNL